MNKFESKANEFKLTTVDLFNLYKSYKLSYNLKGDSPEKMLSISQYIRITLKNMAVGSHGDIVWISRQKNNREIWREKAIFPNSETEKIYHEDLKPTSGKYAEHIDQKNEYDNE